MADNEVVAPEAPEAEIAPEVPTVMTTRDIITALVKDDDDSARAAFHQVLQVRMRDRINPPETTDSTEASDEESTESDA